MQGLSDSNRTDATTEMKKVIAEAQLAGTMWTTDWAGVQLQRCVLAFALGLLFTNRHQPPTETDANWEQAQIVRSAYMIIWDYTETA